MKHPHKMWSNWVQCDTSISGFLVTPWIKNSMDWPDLPPIANSRTKCCCLKLDAPVSSAGMATRCVAKSHLCYNNEDHFQLRDREEWSHLLISPILFSSMFCVKCYICLPVVERGCLHYLRNSLSQLKEHNEPHPKTFEWGTIHFCGEEFKWCSNEWNTGDIIDALSCVWTGLESQGYWLSQGSISISNPTLRLTEFIV